ncbi:aspartate-semialdehyde dehydrogenase, partial [Candidatus Gottesmanbacteria bacterium]|nr:aspartate-semialdehyde dehydrogenase [Candidatus Gottesmanbacteria bacterium]
PEMVDNVIPYIGGEEEKSEKEPMKIWGEISAGKIKLSAKPKISASCIRVPTTNGHMAAVSVKFSKNPSKEQIIHSVSNFNPLKNLHLPSSPEKLITYFAEDNRPQTGPDRNLGNGMSVTMGRLKEDVFFDWKFIALSHNTIRGAAGGAILLAELLYKKGYIL